MSKNKTGKDYHPRTYKDKHGISYSKLSDLPLKYRKPFKTFLTGQTCPLVEELENPYDAYYPWDFENFKANGKLFFD